MKPIAIFYHCLLAMDGQVMDNAVDIVHGQMWDMSFSGLEGAAQEMHVGINGGQESLDIARLLCSPKSQFKLHGFQCRNENRTILMLEDWLKSHPGWYVLYFHAKGSSHKTPTDFNSIWRKCMMRHVVSNWAKCVADLDAGYDAVGPHWMEPPATPEGHNIFAGNFWWAKSDFLRTLPSIMDRDRIKESGIDALESRYEAEVWIGNGPKPKVKDYHPNWNPSKIDTCKI